MRWVLLVLLAGVCYACQPRNQSVDCNYDWLTNPPPNEPPPVPPVPASSAMSASVPLATLLVCCAVIFL